MPGSSVGSQGVTLPASLHALDPADLPVEEQTTTGNPFVRAPSRKDLAHSKGRPTQRPSRPMTQMSDSYEWDTGMDPAASKKKAKVTVLEPSKPGTGPSAKIPVGVSRLHHVAMDAESIQLEPIYWSPVNDVAEVIRGTWFYKDTMLPVEVDIANMLEVGYLDLQPWTQTWTDELNSAVEVGAAGEMKILHMLWPEKQKKIDSRPTSSAQFQQGLVQSTLPELEDDPEKERQVIVENACDLIDISTGPNGFDNKASGDRKYSHDGNKNIYRKAGVIYANAKEAYLLKPSLQPSDYYGRRPLANYIRKGRAIGVCVTRGFDQERWEKLHPSKKSATAMKARAGVSTSQGGPSLRNRRKSDPELALAKTPQVTDLVLVIHGIGQKLSERIETFHFTHAINAFRREVNVELGTSEVKRHLRKDAGGIMVLPVSTSIVPISPALALTQNR